MEGLGSSIHEIAGIPKDATPRTRVDMGPTEPQLPRASGEGSTNKAVEEAIKAADAASRTPTSAPAAPAAPAGAVEPPAAEEPPSE